MNYVDNPAKIIVFALAFAFVCKTMIVPYLKGQYLLIKEKQHDKKRNAVPRDDKWADTVGELNGRWNVLRKYVVTKQYKPFECIKCMTFWVSMGMAIGCGMQGASAFVGVVGLACGMLLEGILMRYF